MKWINFLHLYQPPTQTKKILDSVVLESYGRIISLLAEYPHLRLTMNISGSLLELFETCGHKRLIKKFAAHVKAGRIELVGSAMYHPILPLINEQEVREQIELQNAISRKWFGEYYKPQGFYLPEMAYSPEIARIVKDMGFEWVILDEIHASKGKPSADTRYSIKDIGLGVIFRDRTVSKTFPPDYVVTNTKAIKEPLVTAHDGELYGHWHKDDRGAYKKAFSHPDIDMQTASEYRESLEKTEEIEVRAANWESTPEELERTVPYALWKDPNNLIHKQLWLLAEYAQTTIAAHTKDPNINEAQTRLHKGLASCAWWWASERILGPLSPLTWNPTETEKGATELLTAIRSLKKIKADMHVEAEQLFSDVHDTLWTVHWKKYNNET